MKTIPSKIKALEWPQAYLSIFQMLKGKSVVGTGRNSKNSNSFKHLCISLIPATMKTIQLKNEVARDFPHDNPIGAICCHGNQSPYPIWPKT